MMRDNIALSEDDVFGQLENIASLEEPSLTPTSPLSMEYCESPLELLWSDDADVTDLAAVELSTESGASALPTDDTLRRLAERSCSTPSPGHLMPTFVLQKTPVRSASAPASPLPRPAAARSLFGKLRTPFHCGRNPHEDDVLLSSREAVQVVTAAAQIMASGAVARPRRLTYGASRSLASPLRCRSASASPAPSRARAASRGGGRDSRRRVRLQSTSPLGTPSPLRRAQSDIIEVESLVNDAGGREKYAAVNARLREPADSLALVEIDSGEMSPGSAAAPPVPAAFGVPESPDSTAGSSHGSEPCLRERGKAVPDDAICGPTSAAPLKEGVYKTGMGRGVLRVRLTSSERFAAEVVRENGVKAPKFRSLALKP